MNFLSIKTAYFGEVSKGKVKRVAFLGYQMLLTISLFFFVLMSILSIGLGEHIIGGDLAQAQQVLRDWLTLPYFILLAVFLAVFFFSSLNVAAKRIRDIGIAGWTTLVIFLMVEILVTVIINQQAASAVHTLIVIFLLFTPSGQFNKLNSKG